MGQTPATHVRGRMARRVPFRLTRRRARRVLFRPYKMAMGRVKIHGQCNVYDN